jgi:outer membrane protein assembly factor BamA
MNRTSRLALCFLVLVSVAAAQKPSTSHRTSPAASPEKLIALKATGTTRYTDKEILGASGLQVGQTAADGDFREAAKRLGDSGLFSDVAYTYTSSGSGMKLELQLTDVEKDKLVPATFENFPWFTNAELLDELQRRVPLFKRELPLAGKLPDWVEETLQAMLGEKHVPGRVDYLRETTQEGGKLIGISYSVESLEIKIRNVEFPGATPDLLPGLMAVSQRLAGAPYRRASLAKVAEVDFLPVCLKSGYLKASFAKADAHVVSQTDSEVEVDAIVPITPGKVYTTSSVEWKGNSAIATAEVAPLLHLTLDQPVDAIRLIHDVETVAKLYRSHGYMAVQIKPEPQFDEAKSTVHYDLIVAEGDQYKMGELEILGLDTQAKAKMAAAWTLRQGEPYNADYLNKFLSDTGQILPRDVQWSVSTHATPDAKDKTVDVEIRFKQQ